MSRRQRSNGMHADTEQEYLKKIQIADEMSHSRIICEELTGFMVNTDFTFTIPETCKNHYLLLLADDFKMSAKRIQSLIEQDYTSVSTLDEASQQIQCPKVYPIDCLVHTQGLHIWNIWTINSLEVHNVFKVCYYPKLSGIVIVSKQQTQTFQHITEEAKCPFYYLNEDEESLQKIMRC